MIVGDGYSAAKCGYYHTALVVSVARISLRAIRATIPLLHTAVELVRLGQAVGEPAGVGALMALMEERKKKLAAEGLFDEARDRKSVV